MDWTGGAHQRSSRAEQRSLACSCRSSSLPSRLLENSISTGNGISSLACFSGRRPRGCAGLRTCGTVGGREEVDDCLEYVDDWRVCCTSALCGGRART